MAKGVKITDVIKVLIAETFNSMYELDPKVTAKEVQAKVNTILREKNPKLDSDWPGVSAVGKVITEIKKKMNELGPDPEDRPWSVSALTLTDYDMPPEALPVVMQAWAKALVENAPLTIRQVKWIARLHCILGNIDGLTVRALEYASREKAIKLTGAYPDKPKNMRGLWFGDAFLYLNMRDKDIEIAKRLMEMYGIRYEQKGGTQ